MNKSLASRPFLIGSLLVALGAYLAIGGTWLAALGGSGYYLPAGGGLLLTGVLVFRRSSAGLWSYALVLAATLIWAVTESHANVWYLAPRLFVPALLGLCLLAPWTLRKLEPSSFKNGAVVTLGILCLLTLALLGGLVIFNPAPTAIAATTPTLAIAGNAAIDNSSDWRHYGRTPSGERYAPFTQISAKNVAQLKVAWVARTSAANGPRTSMALKTFEATPIKIDDTLFLCTPQGSVMALDAETGGLRWTFAPEGSDASPYCRGVSYYDASAKDGAGECPQRIIAPVAGSRIVALNAETGERCKNFGVQGYVDALEGLGATPAGFYYLTSPPLVINDRVIFGGLVQDNFSTDEPSGVVRAIDALTGKFVWAWDMGRSVPATQPLAPSETYTRSTPNAWGAYTADPDLGMVYLPVANPTPDFFGGNRRHFDERYGSAVVALDIATGEVRWSYQTVHHDLWDFDLPIGPSLIDFPTARGEVPALIQSTKRGEFFVLDRRDGSPLVETVEKPVPQNGKVPEERLSPTQPFPIGMPSLAPADLAEKDMWGATLFDQLACRIQYRRMRYEGQFTPPGERKSIAYPAFYGVMDWYGASLDPERKILIANSSYIPFILDLISRQSPEGKKLSSEWAGWEKIDLAAIHQFGAAPQYGTPYLARSSPWLSALRIPCNAPPWGLLTAIDLKTRKILWQQPLGTTRDTGLFGSPYNLPLPVGVPNAGGNIITRSGLIFIGATTDRYLRAYDLHTGRELWRDRLPAGGNATPMSYLGKSGRQFIVIAAGGHKGLGTQLGDYVIAYALPHDVSEPQ